MKMEVDIEVVKGDGRDGLVDKLQVALIVGEAVVRPGVWRVTLERKREITDEY